MNHGLRIGMILLLSVLMTVFVSAAVVLIHPLRSSIGKFLLSNTSGQANSEQLTANTIFVANLQPQNDSTSSASINLNDISATSTDSQVADPTISSSSKYDYRLLREVDSCTLNKLGEQGYQVIQIGGVLDASSGRDADCGKLHIVDVLDWALLVHEK